MHGPSWIALLRRIPVQYHDSLAFALVTGGEIVVQSLLRLEREFVIMRGRMTGSTDVGRIVILPYSQIVNLAFQRRMTEPEVQAIFGQDFEIPIRGEPASTAPGASEAPEEAALLDIGPIGPVATETPEAPDNSQGDPNNSFALAGDEAAADPAAASAERMKSKLPSKSMLLERLRARLAEQRK